MSIRSILRYCFTSLATAVVLTHVVAQPIAQTQTYTGVGGRHEQSRYFIQRNVPNATTGQVPVTSSTTNRRIFVRFLSGSAPEQITGFDLHMKFGIIGEVVPAWIYTANAQNEPGSAVATGQIGIGVGMRYCRASFPSSYTVQPNQLYFIAFQLPAYESLAMATSGSGSQVTYFVGANGAPQQARLQYGVHRDGYSPSITLEQPYIGQDFSVDLSGASLNREAVLWFQLPVPGLPLDLYPFGSPGSVLNLDLHNILFAGCAPGENDRSRRLTFPLANDPLLIGQTMFFQWQVATSDTGIPARWVTSDRAGCVIL
jgi:hypothetical protein